MIANAVIRYGNLLKLSLASALSFKLQNLLTLITMSVGAFTLSATLFIGNGALHSLWQEMETLMGSWMIVSPDPGASGLGSRRFDPGNFSDRELEYLRSHVTSTDYIEPIYSGRGQLAYKSLILRVQLDGITAPLMQEQLFTPLIGSPFSSQAMQGYGWECYITRALHQALGAPSLEGLFVRIGRSRFAVVAVTPDPPEAGDVFAKRAIIPYRLAEQLWQKPGIYGQFAIGWQNIDKAEETLDEVRQALDEVRGEATYYLSSSVFRLKKRREIVQSFVIFGKTQAFFCILVASIGILNVMLANVVHKMKEFAIRRTCGASKADIFFIVITESVFYALVGASLGILLSIWFSPDICTLISNYFEAAKGLTPQVSADTMAIPLLVCAICGLVAGITPAVRAVRTDILSILRAE